MAKPHKQNVIGAILFVVFLIVAVGLAAALCIVFAPVELTLEEDSYTLSFFIYHKESASYEDLAEVALLTDETYASECITSYGGISKAFGTYTNEEYGEHFRLTYSENTHNFILLKRKDGSVTVFNQKSVAATEELYLELAEKV